MAKFFEPIEFNFTTNEVEFVKGKEKKFYVRGYASTSDVDRQDEIITREALKNAEQDLLKNSTVFFEHNYSQPIGKVTKARVDNKGLFIEAYISETLPKIRILIKEGILNRFSIGGRVLEADTVFDESIGKDITRILRMELFEVSLVGVPANAEARVIDYVLKSAVNKVISQTENTEKKEAEEMADEKKKVDEAQKETQPSVEEKKEEKVEKTEASTKVEEKVEEKKEEAKKEEAEEVIEKTDEAKSEASEEAPKEEAKAEEKKEAEAEEEKEEAVAEEAKVGEKKEETIQKEEIPEDLVEKTTEEEVDLVNSIATKIDEIHKRVLSESRPVMALYDKDVEIIATNIDKLEVGSDVTLMVKAKIVTKGKTETETAVYKGLELVVSDIEMVGEPTKEAVKEESKVEEKKDETPVEEKTEKKEEKAEIEKSVEKVEEKPTRKGIVEDAKDDTVTSIAKKLDGKTPEEILNDEELFSSLDKDVQDEIKREYKKSMLR